MGMVDRSSRRGPIPLPAAERRVHCVSVRLHAGELAIVDARRGRLQRGEYLRVAALDRLPPPPPPEINRQAWADLGRLASNLNQIAKRMWMYGERERSEIERSEIESLVSLISELRAELISFRARARAVCDQE